MKKIFLVSLLVVMLLPVNAYAFTDTEWPWEEAKVAAERCAARGYIVGFEDGSFRPTANMTVGEALTIFARVMDAYVDDVKYDHWAMRYARAVRGYGILLPKDLVYDKTSWKNSWDYMIKKTDKAFVKTSDGRYSSELIEGYFKLYVNKQGYEQFKRGFIPKSLDFYSAYGSIPYFDASVLDSKISKGFYMELMSLIDMVKSSGMYSASTNAVRTQFIRTLTIINFEASLKKSESDWYDYDINKYDYAAINYAGQMNYGILTGIIYSNNTLSDMRRDISRAEAVTMLNRVLTKSKNRNIINDMRYVNETKDISVFAPYILR